MATFGITTPRALLEKLTEELRDFEAADCLSARYAINAVMTAYHLHEWVWGELVKKRLDLHSTWRLSPGRRANRGDFKDWIKGQCPAIIEAEKVTNGAKHFNMPRIPTGRHQGAFQRNAFQSNAFDVPHLWIERNGQRQRAEDFIKELVEFWIGFFKEYVP
jgi:hypothetical protein